MIFPFVEVIEELIRKAKQFGSWLYWTHIAIISCLIGGIVLAHNLNGVSWNDTKPLWILSVMIWFIPIPYIYRHEKRWKKERLGKNK